MHWIDTHQLNVSRNNNNNDITNVKVYRLADVIRQGELGCSDTATLGGSSVPGSP